MLTYRDKTHCIFWEECKKGDTCHRALTKEKEEHAKKINLPVAYFTEEPDCFESTTCVFGCGKVLDDHDNENSCTKCE